MSTWVYFVCIDHDPVLVADAESGQHNEVEAMRELLDHREDWLDIADDERITISDRYAANGVRFFQQHPRCRLACKNEYAVWTDLGAGLPPHVKTDLDDPA